MRGPHVRFCERKEAGKLFPAFTYSIQNVMLTDNYNYVNISECIEIQ